METDQVQVIINVLCHEDGHKTTYIRLGMCVSWQNNVRWIVCGIGSTYPYGQFSRFRDERKSPHKRISAQDWCYELQVLQLVGKW